MVFNTLPDRPIDMHVHIVGNGSGGTGCWLQVRGWHRPWAALMERHIGLPPGAMKGDLDRLYVERLLELVRESYMGAVVILAQDEVYDEQGCVMAGAGSFYVPNEYVLRLAREHPERNVLERDYQLKLATGFAPESFTRIRNLLRWPQLSHQLAALK